MRGEKMAKEKSQEVQEILEVLEVGEEKDFSVDITSKKPEKIPTRTVSLFLEEMESKDTINQPFLFIILPFFTSKRQRNVNLIYDIKNAGIKFGASLSSDGFEGFQNKQPSDFEKNVFYFILYKFQESLMSGSKDNKITFCIDEVIEYLGLKFSMKYYRKMEETLYNLQETTYRFKIRNKRKAGNIIREVYKKPLNLIRYEKIKEKNLETNKMKVYYKVDLDSRILEELRIKHYSIFDKNLLSDLRKLDRAAEKIYQFISMKRFDQYQGEYRVETLATIVPLSVYTYIKKKLKDGTVKEYRVSKLKQVTKRIKKAFDVLVKMGYLLKYEMVSLEGEKTFKIRYYFNADMDNKAHITDYLPKKQEKLQFNFDSVNNISVKTIPVVQKSRFSPKLEEEIRKTKRNIYFSKSYNKRTENKLLRLLQDHNEEFVIELLKIVYTSLKREINKTLVSYINGVLKKCEKDGSGPFALDKKEEIVGRIEKVEEPQKVFNATNKRQEIEEAQIVSEEKIKKFDPLASLLMELYDKMSLEEKEEIEHKAKNRYLLETKSTSLNGVHKQIFKTSKKSYIIQIMKEEKGF